MGLDLTALQTLAIATALLGLPSLLHVIVARLRREQPPRRSAAIAITTLIAAVVVWGWSAPGAVQATRVASVGVFLVGVFTFLASAPSRAGSDGSVVEFEASPRLSIGWWGAFAFFVVASSGVSWLEPIPYERWQTFAVVVGTTSLITFLWYGRLRLALLFGAVFVLAAIGIGGAIGWYGRPVDDATPAIALVGALFIVAAAVHRADGVLRRFRHPAPATLTARRVVIVTAPIMVIAAALAAVRIRGFPEEQVAWLELVGLAGGLLSLVVVTGAIPTVVERITRPSRSTEDWREWIRSRLRFAGPALGHYAYWKIRQDPLPDALPELCPGDGELLVVGCGFGIMTSRLALAYPDRTVWAVDVDARKLEIVSALTRECENVRVVKADIREWDQHSRSIEVAFLIDVLHYWPTEEQRAIVDAAAATLASGGRLVVRDICATGGADERTVSNGERVARFLGFTKNFGNFHFRTADGWRQLLCDAGFEVEVERSDLGTGSNRVFVARRVEA